MAVKIAHSSHDENGKYHGGKAGNQSNECEIRDWYNRPWTHVIRFKDVNQAERLAIFMVNASKNRNIGYDQGERNTLHRELLKVGFDVSKVSRPCETDCSALVSDAVIYSGVKESVMFVDGNLTTTYKMRERLVSTGLVNVYTGRDYIAGTSKLMRGDILLNEQQHVAVVVETEPKVTSVKKPNYTVAQEVILGLWGNGDVRKSRLTSVGYDYNTIQKIVNEILTNNIKIISYTVVRGDTLSKIAYKYNTTVGKIVEYNGIDNPNVIRIGQVLIIPNK